jgi:hypothetical protein
MRRVTLMVTGGLVMAAMLALAGVAWAQGTSQPVDPPPRSTNCVSSSKGLPQKRQRPRGTCQRDHAFRVLRVLGLWGSTP